MFFFNSCRMYFPVSASLKILQLLTEWNDLPVNLRDTNIEPNLGFNQNCFQSKTNTSPNRSAGLTFPQIPVSVLHLKTYRQASWHIFTSTCPRVWRWNNASQAVLAPHVRGKYKVWLCRLSKRSLPPPHPTPTPFTEEPVGCPWRRWPGPPAGSSPAVPASVWWWCHPSTPGRRCCLSVGLADTDAGPLWLWGGNPTCHDSIYSLEALLAQH